MARNFHCFCGLVPKHASTCSIVAMGGIRQSLKIVLQKWSTYKNFTPWEFVTIRYMYTSCMVREVCGDGLACNKILQLDL